MSMQLKCEIIRDLLPSYVDEQTSEVTNLAVEEHVAECQECADILRRMKEPQKEFSDQKEEIDYLKKVKNSRRKTAWIVAITAVAIYLIVAAVMIFVRGTKTDLNAQAFSFAVEGNVIRVEGNLVDSGQGVARVTFEEKDGIIDISLYTAPSMPFNQGSFYESYVIKADELKMITCDGLVIWENGERISQLTAKLFAAKHAYIGDMSANQKIANVIGLTERYGTYTNELQTSEEPYGWTISLEEPIDAADEERMKQKMASDACLLIATVDNLSRVTWKYENGSGTQEYTIDLEEANKITGEDIKSFAKSASKLQKLIDLVRQ